MPLPTKITDQGVEDIQSIQDDIETLYTQFVIPIENTRSIAVAAAGSLNDAIKTALATDLTTAALPIESRAHAFYRMLGLPVVDSGGKSYNPGFNPDLTSLDTRDSIGGNQAAADLTLMQKREDQAQLLQSIFNKQDLGASIFALAMGSHPKTFNNLAKDEQTFTMDQRAAIVNTVSLANPDLAAQITTAMAALASSGVSISGNFHILKPFNVNPQLEYSVQPMERMLAVPFLVDATATRSSASPEVLHTRPGIEYILRVRLQDNVPDNFFMADMQKILSQEKSPNPTFVSDLNTDVLRSTLVALADQNQIDNADINQLFTGITSTEANVIKQLVKTIKAVIKKLYQAVHQLDIVRQSINFLPVPDPKGPEYGGKLFNTMATSKLDNRIINLTLQKYAADRQPELDKNLGNFATPFLNLTKTDTFTTQLNKLQQQKQALGQQGLQALREIEIITGEVSGLGLIDILAFYLALWSLKLEDVLGLLDTDAFNRLYSNVSLRVGPVAGKSSTDVKTALTNLQTRIVNILSFADLLFEKESLSPQSTDRGTI